MAASDCLFCKIADGSVPADVVHRDEHVVAFRDINPQAPAHILVIPRTHIGSLDEAGREHADMLGRLMVAARDMARAEGIAEGGYRTVMNVGSDGGQTVHHLHLHVLGGRAMRWPPG